MFTSKLTLTKNIAKLLVNKIIVKGYLFYKFVNVFIIKLNSTLKILEKKKLV